MAIKTRKCTLANANIRNINLKKYEQIIIDTINQTVPGKDPKVYWGIIARHGYKHIKFLTVLDKYIGICYNGFTKQR